MAETVLTDVGIWIDGFNYDFVSNSVALDVSADTPESTTFKDARLGWRTRAPDGLKNADFSLEGFFNTVGLDEDQFDTLGTERSVMVTPAGIAAGDVAYIVPVAVSGHQLGGSIGDLLAFTYAAEGDGQPYRAQLFDVREGVTADVNTSRRQLGALAADAKIQVWVHVIRNAGSLELVLGSSDTPSSSITDRATESGINETGLYVLEFDGPQTDDWWRIEYNVSGGSPDFDMAAAVLIG